MSLQERLSENRALNTDDEKKITNLIKDKIKKSDYLFNPDFDSKEEFRDKLFILIYN
jgi:hypothetical protein